MYPLTMARPLLLSGACSFIFTLSAGSHASGSRSHASGSHASGSGSHASGSHASASGSHASGAHSASRHGFIGNRNAAFPGTFLHFVVMFKTVSFPFPYGFEIPHVFAILLPFCGGHQLVAIDLVAVPRLQLVSRLQLVPVCRSGQCQYSGSEQGCDDPICQMPLHCCLLEDPDSLDHLGFFTRRQRDLL